MAAYGNHRRNGRALVTNRYPKRVRHGDAVDEGVVRDLGTRTQWVDLDGEGIAGLLTQTETAMYYARNLGGHKLARARRLPTRPALGGGELRDIDGDGTLELVRVESPPQGFFERDTEGDDWGSFRPFRQLPGVDWSSPQTRLIDLDGDGFDDVLGVTPSSYVYYPSKAEEGFGPPKTVLRSSDEERAPGVPFFTTAAAAVFLADMTGDGLADLVRVEPTRVVYWPNLGHARFGPMVVMSSSPHCEPGRRFDGARVRLADLDGTGTADLLYFGPDGLTVWFNQSGNRYSAPVRVPGFPVGDVMSSVSIADVRGNGTSCVTWVPSRRASAPAAVVRVLDFVGPDKPYLLTFAENNLGLETTVTYAPSTKFYLADRAAGRPSASRLPFPVQVVEKVETYDAIAKARLTKAFAYHHGAYDPDEREFRGFGMVESWDTESFAAVDGKGVLPPGPPPVGGEQAQHPVRTRTWFHTGVWKKSATLEAAYAKEYYSPVAPDPDSALPVVRVAVIRFGQLSEPSTEVAAATCRHGGRHPVEAADGRISRRCQADPPRHEAREGAHAWASRQPPSTSVTTARATGVTARKRRSSTKWSSSTGPPSASAPNRKVASRSLLYARWRSNCGAGDSSTAVCDSRARTAASSGSLRSRASAAASARRASAGA